MIIGVGGLENERRWIGEGEEVIWMWCSRVVNVAISFEGKTSESFTWVHNVKTSNSFLINSTHFPWREVIRGLSIMKAIERLRDSKKRSLKRRKRKSLAKREMGIFQLNKNSLRLSSSFFHCFLPLIKLHFIPLFLHFKKERKKAS